MDRRSVISGLAVWSLMSCLARAEDAKPWSYDGTEGPDKWAGLDAANQACGSGLEQSPIDLKNYYIASLEPLEMNWQAQPFPMVNNGRSVYATVAKGSTTKLGEEEYQLKQIIFHLPSEHVVEGKRHAMEIQFVHTLGTKKMLMLSVLVQPGDRNEVFSLLMARAPGKLGTQPLPLPADPAALLPKSRNIFRYRGSLTMPPCTENVDWIVFGEPIQAAQSDIDVFKLIFANNARPLQPINRRFLLKGIF